jgi:phosphatidylglycerol:prolipoprotein diacylglycerol transferase
MLGAIVLSAIYWIHSSKKDSRLPLIYFGALGGAFFGAKLAYLISEGWLHMNADDRWLHWMTGKSVTGALLGGYIGVEAFKKLVGYTATTGDRFALVAPVGIIIGRLGCLTHGCCQGIPCHIGSLDRWPAVPVEITFNLIALTVIVILHRRKLQQGQLFHLYLIAYGLFRFAHEFLRDTPKPFLGLSGYQIISLLLAILATAAYAIRRRNSCPP